MKWRYATPLMLLLVAACGSGGSGPSSTTIPISVIAMRSPVLVTYTSNTVQTITTVPDGTPVKFTASSPAISLIPATTTVAGGVATIRVKSSAPGKYLITATSTVGTTVYTGSASVTFINQPASVNLYIALRPTINSLGELQFSIVNDPGISVFQNYSSNPGFFFTTFPEPGSPPSNNRTNAAAISANGVTIASTDPLFRLTYSIGANGGLPGFTVDPASVQATFANLSTVRPTPSFLLNWRYDTDTF